MPTYLLILALLQLPLTLRVTDPLGLPVAGATVRAGSSELTTDAFGEAMLPGTVPEEFEVQIDRPGFETFIQTFARWSGVQVVQLRLGAITDEIVVAATRSEQRLGDVPASVNVLRGEQIKESPAVVADDVLRQIPTFSLFRRTSSLAAHPTAQGVSLRGVGPSGVSRTLVLLDGVPFNDPFGGWVYWTRVPLLSVDQIEVVDGTSSSLYGNYAMGGVINIVTARPQRRTLILKPQYGNMHSPKVDFFASDVWDKLGVVIEGSTFDTNGYPVLAAADRGRVDTKADVDYRNINLKLDYAATDRITAFFRGGYFTENRSNARIMENNDSKWWTASGGLRVQLPDQSALQAQVFTDLTRFRSTFLSVPPATPPRSIGRLFLLQRVPTEAAGAMVQWSRPFGGNHYFTAGADWRRIDGDSNEDSLDAATGTQVTVRRISGGTQRSTGVFLQDVVRITPSLLLTLSARLDHWRNYDAKNLETFAATGQLTANNRLLPEKDNAVGSPRFAARYHVTDAFSVWGGMSWGFRAPTLNELYRQFGVGTTLILANDQLGPERLVGGETGINYEPVRNLTWRSTWFDNRFKNAVSNITVSVTPALTTRQRMNVGKTRIWGIQNDLEYSFLSHWRVSAAYVYEMARIKEFSLNPGLVGKFLQQVPRHRGSLQLSYSNPIFASIAAQARYVGAQFDDDLNTRNLRQGGFTTVDVMTSRDIGENVEVFFGIQNLFDREFVVGFNPRTIGAPRQISGGFRLSVTGR
jgi:outer membrane receptor for ferrienterochelin and colicin